MLGLLYTISRNRPSFCFRHDDRKRKTCTGYLKMWWSQIKIRQLFPTYILAFAYLSFTSMYIPHFLNLSLRSSSHLPLVSDSHHFFLPLSLLQLLLVHFISFLHHFVLLRLCLNSNIAPKSVLSALTASVLYLYSLPGFTCALVSHSTTQFFSKSAHLCHWSSLI